MRYVSTRDSGLNLRASEAIVMGLSRDGGLFLPSQMPELDRDALEKLVQMNYYERAVTVMKLFLEEFSEQELAEYAAKAYHVPEKFDSEAVAPVVTLADGTHILELWHGPSHAFKDMALRCCRTFWTASLKKTGEEKTVCILWPPPETPVKRR